MLRISNYLIFLFLFIDYFFRARGIYYVSTNPQPPYAQGPPKKHVQRGLLNRLF